MSRVPEHPPEWLDLSSPSGWRRIADELLNDANTMTADGELGSSMHNVGRYLRERAARLDRERAEAEQDAADRKRAEEIAALDTESLDSRAYSREVGLVLAGIRAGRAERLEVGQ